MRFRVSHLLLLMAFLAVPLMYGVRYGHDGYIFGTLLLGSPLVWATLIFYLVKLTHPKDKPIGSEWKKQR